MQKVVIFAENVDNDITERLGKLGYSSLWILHGADYHFIFYPLFEGTSPVKKDYLPVLFINSKDSPVEMLSGYSEVITWLQKKESLLKKGKKRHV